MKGKNRGKVTVSMKQMMEQLKTEKGLGEYQNIAHGHEAVKVNWKKTILMNLVGMHGSSKILSVLFHTDGHGACRVSQQNHGRD